MIDHVSISVSNLAASTAFYEKVLGAIGMAKLVGTDVASGFGKNYPEFWLKRDVHCNFLMVSANSYEWFRHNHCG